MARPLRIQFPGAHYHLMCRGNSRQRIFYADDDRSRFVSLLADSAKTYSVRIHAYILMDNHYHLLIQTLKPNCAEFVRTLNVTYVGWFNHRHDRYGHLFQGRYKAIVIDADNYLLEVSRYIHLNALRTPQFSASGYERRLRHLSSYRWSSLPGYMRAKNAVAFVYYDLTLSMTGGRKSYSQFVIDAIKKEVKNPFMDVKYGLLLGDESFVKKIRAECIEEGSKQEQPSYRELVVQRVNPHRVIEQTAKACSVTEKEILACYVNSEARSIAADLLYKYSDLTQSQIGDMLGGISYSAVSKLRSRLQSRIAKKQKIAVLYEAAEKGIRKLSIVKI
ncbi:MAG: transposase [candidate division WOR-3 bacterium]|nr:MAG: transposase [candidate division WOR-3 bacterium]